MKVPTNIGIFGATGAGTSIGKITDAGVLVDNGRIDKHWSVVTPEKWSGDASLRNIENYMLDSDFFIDRFNLKSVEYGNWMNQQDRQNYLYNTAISFDDLAKVLGIAPDEIGLQKNLSMAFGARGVSKGYGHFERLNSAIINLTKVKGRKGALAHEYGHALDNLIGLAIFGDSRFVTGRSTRKNVDEDILNNGNQFEKWFEQFFEALYYKEDGGKTAFYNKMVAMDSDYWESRIEIWARFFEQYISYKQRDNKEENKFLCRSFSYYSKSRVYIPLAEFNAALPFAEKIIKNGLKLLLNQSNKISSHGVNKDYLPQHQQAQLEQKRRAPVEEIKEIEVVEPVVVKKGKKLTIADKVLAAATVLKSFETHSQLRQWAIDNGMDNRSAFSNFKKALKEKLGIDYAAVRNTINEGVKADLLKDITHEVTLYSDAKASHNRFAVTDKNGTPVWFGMFFKDDNYYNGEQSTGELSAAAKAVWFASKVKEYFNFKAIRLNLFVDAQWLTYQDHAKQKGYVLTKMAKQYNIDLHVNWIPGTENPADEYTTTKGFLKWSDSDFRLLADEIKENSDSQNINGLNGASRFLNLKNRGMRNTQFNGILGATEVLNQNTGIDYNGMKPTYKVLESYDHLISKSTGKTLLYKKGGLDETIAAIKLVTNRDYKQVEKLAQHLKADTKAQTAFNVWHFIKTYIKYGFDLPEQEEIRTPARTWSDRTFRTDCEDMGIFAGCIFKNLGIDFSLTIVGFRGTDFYQHIYVTVKAADSVSGIDGRKNELVIDGVMAKYGVHPDNIIRRMDINIMGSVKSPIISGLGAIAPADNYTLAVMKTRESLRNELATAKSSAVIATLNKEIRKATYMIMLNGTPEREVMMRLMHVVEDVDRVTGEITFKKEANLAKVAQFLEAANQIIDQGEDGQINGLFKKIGKKIKNAAGNVGDFVNRNINSAIDDIKNVGGKVLNAAIRYNPVFIPIRAAFLTFLRLNIGGLAKKIAHGYLSQAEATQRGYHLPDWHDYLLARMDAEKKWETFGGTKGDFKAAVKAGASRGGMSISGLGEVDVEAILKVAGPIINIITSIFKNKKEPKVDANNANNPVPFTPPPYNDGNANGGGNNGSGGGNDDDDDDDSGTPAWVLPVVITSLAAGGFFLYTRNN